MNAIPQHGRLSHVPCPDQDNTPPSAGAAATLAAMHRANAASLSRYLHDNPRLPQNHRDALRASIASKLAMADAAEQAFRAPPPRTCRTLSVGELIADMFPAGHPLHVPTV